jgi:hypothetical protein
MTEIPRIVFCIAGFTISFLGYMSARYREDWSIIKNIIVNARFETFFAVFDLKKRKVCGIVRSG